jgi:hypothetical protein
VPSVIVARFKQGVIARVGGLVVSVTGDRIVFDPELVGSAQFRSSAGRFRYQDDRGNQREVPVSPGTLALTIEHVLVVVHRAGPPWIAVVLEDGSIRSQTGLTLDAETSAEILSGGSRVHRLDVYLGVQPAGRSATSPPR